MKSIWEGKMRISISVLKKNAKKIPASIKSARKLNGGRDKDRTCDPYDVNVVLYR